jgi:predicted enzyme related to lactoylglutathione lyase
MIRYKEISFIAYAVTRMARSRKFYEKVLGLKPNSFSSGKMKSMWMEYDIGPGTLAIGVSEEFKPSKHGSCAALEVMNFDAAIAQLKKHRVKFIIGPKDFPCCRMVAFRDPDGNKISLHQRKRNKGK